MDEEKKKEGVSVKEIENYAKKHRYEVFYCLLFLLASLFTLVFWGAVFSILLAGLGGIIGAFIPHKVDQLVSKMFAFVLNQDKTVQLVLAGVALIIAIFIAPVIFLLTGLLGGKSMVEKARQKEV